jgi:hypothetical protein
MQHPWRQTFATIADNNLIVYFSGPKLCGCNYYNNKIETRDNRGVGWYSYLLGGARRKKRKQAHKYGAGTQ